MQRLLKSRMCCGTLSGAAPPEQPEEEEEEEGEEKNLLAGHRTGICVCVCECACALFLSVQPRGQRREERRPSGENLKIKQIYLSRLSEVAVVPAA